MYNFPTLPSGTTTATVLTRAILAEGAKSVAAGMNPMDLRRGINVATQAVVEDLKQRATNISTTEEISQVRDFPFLLKVARRFPSRQAFQLCRHYVQL